jgi:hypothetical protein
MDVRRSSLTEGEALRFDATRFWIGLLLRETLRGWW